MRPESGRAWGAGGANRAGDALQACAVPAQRRLSLRVTRFARGGVDDAQRPVLVHGAAADRPFGVRDRPVRDGARDESSNADGGAKARTPGSQNSHTSSSFRLFRPRDRPTAGGLRQPRIASHLESNSTVARRCARFGVRRIAMIEASVEPRRLRSSHAVTARVADSTRPWPLLLLLDPCLLEHSRSPSVPVLYPPPSLKTGRPTGSRSRARREAWQRSNPVWGLNSLFILASEMV